MWVEGKKARIVTRGDENIILHCKYREVVCIALDRRIVGDGRRIIMPAHEKREGYA